MSSAASVDAGPAGEGVADCTPEVPDIVGNRLDTEIAFHTIVGVRWAFEAKSGHHSLGAAIGRGSATPVNQCVADSQYCVWMSMLPVALRTRNVPTTRKSTSPPVFQLTVLVVWHVVYFAKRQVFYVVTFVSFCLTVDAIRAKLLRAVVFNHT
ncbi:hypothetical protein ACLMJK_007055 [Lecanora helva]